MCCVMVSCKFQLMYRMIERLLQSRNMRQKSHINCHSADGLNEKLTEDKLTEDK